MKNINRAYLLQNAVRCMIAYPAFFVAFVLALLLDVAFWIVIALEMLGRVSSLIIHGKFAFHDSLLYEIFWNVDGRLNAVSDITASLFLFSTIVVEKLSEFHSSLLPVQEIPESR